MATVQTTARLQEYKDQRNRVNYLISSAKASYLRKKIKEKSGDTKAIFRIANSIMGTSTMHKLPDHDSAKELAERFNKFFINKIGIVRRELNCENSSLDAAILTKERDVTPLVQFRLTTNDEISHMLSKSAPKTCGLDPVPTSLVIRHADVLAPTIAAIVNMSMQDGLFPPCLKNAHVTPRLKKPSLDPNTLENFRPVSNFPFLSKVVERAINERLQEHLVSNDLHQPMQSAYCPGHSSETALVRVTNDLLSALDRKEAIILVLFDLSTAFDTVDHEVLLHRLEFDCGIREIPLQWIRSYLTGRSQETTINGISSSSVALKYGVPQGSVLGPVLFTCYVRPLENIARKSDLGLHTYADDNQLYITFNPLNDTAQAVKKIEACVDEMRSWMKKNALKMNDEKTEVLIISSPTNRRKFNIDHLRIGESDISPATSVRDLGVMLDQSLNMEKQINSLCSRCHFYLRSISKIRHLLDEGTTATLVHAFVTSRLDNGNALLFDLPDTLLQKLQRVQNASARLVTRTGRRDRITPILQQLHWLPVKSRIEFKIHVLTHQAICGLGPHYLSDLLDPYHPPENPPLHGLTPVGYSTHLPQIW